MLDEPKQTPTPTGESLRGTRVAPRGGEVLTFWKQATPLPPRGQATGRNDSQRCLVTSRGLERNGGAGRRERDSGRATPVSSNIHPESTHCSHSLPLHKLGSCAHLFPKMHIQICLQKSKTVTRLQWRSDYCASLLQKDQTPKPGHGAARLGKRSRKQAIWKPAPHPAWSHGPENH